MRVWVKICGVTDVEDACFAVECGADAIGVNFWPGSSRYCSNERARAICEAVNGAVPVYGVFAGASKIEIEKLVERTGIDAVQLHGGESAREAVGYRVPVIRAVAVRSAEIVTAALAEAVGHRVLLDTPKSKSPDARFGGSGIRFDPHAIAGLDLSAAIVAGGLTPENVADTVRTFSPFGVDTAGGVESAPGRKDRRRVREFIDNAKSA